MQGTSRLSSLMEPMDVFGGRKKMPELVPERSEGTQGLPGRGVRGARWPKK